MSELQSLRSGLLELLKLLDEKQCPLILGGGYGLFLRREHLQNLGTRTLLNNWPEARSTNDLDLFLHPEVLCDSDRIVLLKQAIGQLGYEPIPGCEYYQFRKDDPEGNIQRGLKIDLLTGPESEFQGQSAKADSRRVKPQPSVKLHAHPTNEAITLQDHLERIPLQISSLQISQLADSDQASEPVAAHIYLPHPFTYTVMKLFAFRDRIPDLSQDRGSHHSLDLYSIIAMMTEVQWEQSLNMRLQHQADAAVVEATQIATDLFSSKDSQGMLILRGNPYCSSALQLEEFRETLLELFGVN